MQTATNQTIRNGKDATVPHGEQPLSDSLADLLEFARDRDGEGLPTAGPWSLNSEVTRKLADTLGYDPPGGWSRLAELLL